MRLCIGFMTDGHGTDGHGIRWYGFSHGKLLACRHEFLRSIILSRYWTVLARIVE